MPFPFPAKGSSKMRSKAAKKLAKEAMSKRKGASGKDEEAEKKGFPFKKKKKGPPKK